MRILLTALVLVASGCGNGASPGSSALPESSESSASASASTSPPVALEQPAGDPAADLVRNFRLGSNLEQMAIAVAGMTHTSTSVPAGEVAAEIHRLAPKYQAQWDENLAKAHSRHLSPEALRSIATEGRGSSFYPALEQNRLAISADMKAMSSPILQQLVAEALANVVESR